MIVKYYCSTCNKAYDTEKEALECERKHEEESKKKEERRKKKKELSEQISKLIEKFYDTYGEFPEISLSVSKCQKDLGEDEKEEWRRNPLKFWFDL